MTAPPADELLDEFLDALAHLVAAYRARARAAADERAAQLAELYDAPALGTYRKDHDDADMG